MNSNIGALFPGQGSQHPGMGQFLVDNFKEAAGVFEEASDALNLDLKKLCFSGSDEDLALTHNTQPALLTVSVAAFRVVRSLTDSKPIAGAGHSIGEYAALVTSEAISLVEAVRAVRKRGEAMQAAVPLGVGGMAAIMGVGAEHISTLCTRVEEANHEKPLEPANFNCPGQIVISGKKSLLDWLQTNIKTMNDPNFARAKVIPLKVSAPFHCSLMKPAEEVMRKVLEVIQFNDARYPVVQNFNAKPTTAGDALRENVIRQISAPVRWIECVEQLRCLGATKLVEFGSGKVLSGLVKKIDSTTLQTFNLNSLEELKALEEALKN